jgi:hypothetical protein
VGITVAQLPESYTLTLTLSHTWERGYGPDPLLAVFMFQIHLVSHFDLDSCAYIGNQKR